jgi:transposase-like protein
MADAESMSVREAAGKIRQQEHGDVLRGGRAVVHEVMEAEVAAQIGADRYERSERHLAHRNGSAAAVGYAGGDARFGDREAAIRLVLSELLEPRRRSEQALVAVVQEAYIRVFQAGSRAEASEILREVAGRLTTPAPEGTTPLTLTA